MFGYVLLLTLISLTSAAAGDTPLVRVRQGQLRGSVTYARGSENPVYTFLGVPYAAPPVGERRFQPSHPSEDWGWEGVKDATQPAPYCMQDLSVMQKAMANTGSSLHHNTSSEDCLYLEIYSPDLQPTTDRAVMVWIHGGALDHGMGGITPGTALAAFEDVVVVTINFRLGAFGWLSTDDDAATGNYGLHDQITALNWIQDNIQHFGADPNNVTIFGQGAGSMCVSALATSAMTGGLFHRAILQSGSSLLHPGHTTNHRDKTNTLAKQLDCPVDDTTRLVDCLRHKPAEDILSTYTKLQRGEKHPMYFGLANDGMVITEKRVFDSDALENHNVELMAGVMGQDGAVLAEFFPEILAEKLTREKFVSIVRHLVTMWYTKGVEEIVSGAMAKYVTKGFEKYTAKDLVKKLMTIYGDMEFAIPTYHAARLMARRDVPTYFYKMPSTPRTFHTGYPGWVKGAHGAEVGYVIGEPFTSKGTIKFSDNDKAFSRMIMKYWSNFAKHGSPNGEGLAKWPVLYAPDFEYLKLTSTPKPATDYRPSKYRFWSETVPKLAEKAYITLREEL